MKIVRRFQAFRDRNRGFLASALQRDIFVRLWIRLRLWRLVGPLVPRRTPKHWVFMGGCYNSGTTILREILGSHPQIATLPREGVIMTSAFPDLERDGWQRMWCRNAELSEKWPKVPQEVAKEAQRDWSLWWARGKDVFLEKSIVHGAWMPALDEGFKNCRFIGVMRNGFCAAEGIRRRARPMGKARELLGRDTYRMADAAAQWVLANERLQRDAVRVSHYLEVRYEEFVSDPAAILTRLFQFIGVDETAFTYQKGTIEIGGRSFEIRDDNARSMARLTHSDRADFIQVAGTTMTKLGYQAEIE